MIKKLRFLILIGAILIASYFFWSQQNKMTHEDEIKATPSKENAQDHNVDVEKLQIDGKKVIGLTPGKEKEEIKKIRVMNFPTQDWDEGLKTILKTQAGNSLKEIDLKKIDSFVWIHQGIPLFVESVIVSLKGQDNQSVNFRVLVDSQTGKVLQSWDQPVMDPMDPRTNFKIKVDPRYHSDD